MLNQPRFFDWIMTKWFYEQNIEYYMNKPSCFPLLPIQDWFYEGAWDSLQYARAQVKWNTDTPSNKFNLIPEKTRMDNTPNAFPDDFFDTLMATGLSIEQGKKHSNLI